MAAQKHAKVEIKSRDFTGFFCFVPSILSRIVVQLILIAVESLVCLVLSLPADSNIIKMPENNKHSWKYKILKEGSQ